MNDSAGVGILAHLAIEEVFFADHSFFQRSRRENGFERRTGFVTVRDRAITTLISALLIVKIGIEGWIIGQGQHFAGERIDNNRDACFGAVFEDRSFQFFFSDVLNRGVERQMNVAARRNL